MNTMKNKKVWTIVGLIVIFLQALLETLATIVVMQLNMLPDDYIAVFVLAMVLLLEATALFMFVPVKQRIRLWRRIVSLVLSAVIITGSLFVTKVGYDAQNLLEGVTGDVSNTRSSYVLVRNDSPAQSLKETKDFRYGAVGEYDVDHTQQLILVIEQEIETTINLTYYPQAAMVADALYNKEVDALILNGASISLLIEQPGYEEFLSHVRVLHTMPFEEEEPEKEVSKEGIVSAPFVVYISGSDTRSKLLDVSRSDVNILAVVNPTTKQILLLNTPRDYYIPNPAGKGALDKLTHCGNYGIKYSVQALADLYQAQIVYYCQINFTGFEKLIDAIDGVTIHSDETFRTVSGELIKKGENTMDGKTALAFARERYNVSGGDNGRGKNQMKVIKSVIEKMAASKTLISNYADIMKSLDGMFVTNLSSEEIADIVKMQVNDMATWNVQSFAVTGRGDYQETYSWKGENLYVMWPNEDMVQYAINLVDRVFNGEILTEEDTKFPKE